jgi:hypothetical protein
LVLLRRNSFQVRLLSSSRYRGLEIGLELFKTHKTFRKLLSLKKAVLILHGVLPEILFLFTGGL